ncbi:MAG TPA: c-type cytochrome [Candidatus Limnocylindrales bacterium]|nr:c-type cytochrome [Candidatus Limnocylindrales bacterium]
MSVSGTRTGIVVKKLLKPLVSQSALIFFLFLGIFGFSFLFLNENLALAVQSSGVKNPYEGNAQAVEEGAALYKSYCAFCHGTGARGAKGPNLTDEFWKWGGTDEAVFETIAHGRPGTQMGAFLTAEKLNEDKIWKIIAYLRSQATYGDWAQRYPSKEVQKVTTSEWKPPAGITPDPKAGEALFKDPNGKAGCINCHTVNGQGGKVGPDLSHIGDRSPEYLLESIQNPSAYIAPEFTPVQIVTKEGKRFIGIIKHEDDYSIQIRTAQDESLIFSKNDLQNKVPRNVSLMPTINLTDQELYDIVAYLLTLK